MFDEFFWIKLQFEQIDRSKAIKAETVHSKNITVWV